MGERADVGLGAQAAHVLEVEPRRREQQVGVEVPVPDQAADEGEAVRVQARGGKPEDDVARLAAGAVDEVGALHEPDAGAGEVELVVAVDPRKLCALAAEDRAARLAADGRGALDELGDLLEVEGARGDVVQEEERVGARRDDVVDAVGGEVDASVEEPAGAAGEDQLRSDAVHRGGQEALVVQRMEAREAAEGSAGRARPRRAGARRRPRPFPARRPRPRRSSRQHLGHELGAALGPRGEEAHDALAEVHARALALEEEDLGQRDRFLLGVVGAQVELADLELVGLRERVVDPVARRMHLEPVAGLRGDEGALARVVLDLQTEVAGAIEDGLVVVLVERDAEVVDARHVPVTGLEDDVHGPASDLDEPQAEADLVEVLPGRSGLEPVRALASPAVAADELEAELAEIPGLEEPDLARHEVVVEQMHRAAPSYRRGGISPLVGNGATMTQSTPPPPPPTQGYGQPYYGMPAMPAPNGELVVFLLVWAVVFIITVASDRVDWPEFTTATVFLAAAYMISRGIAKAGKVLEGH